MVEHHLAKVRVAGSNPVARSKWSSQVAGGRVHKIAVNTVFSMPFVPREPVGGLGVPAERVRDADGGGSCLSFRMTPLGVTRGAL